MHRHIAHEPSELPRHHAARSLWKTPLDASETTRVKSHRRPQYYMTVVSALQTLWKHPGDFLGIPCPNHTFLRITVLQWMTSDFLDFFKNSVHTLFLIIFSELWDPCDNQLYNNFITPNSHFVPSPNSRSPICRLYEFVYSDCFMSIKEKYDVAFCDWILSGGIKFSRFIYIAVWISTLFLLTGE